MRLGLRRFAGAANGDATTLDGLDSSAFALTGHSHGAADHGALTGLGDDDHTQYLLATGARTGATSQAQTFTNGVATGKVIAIADSANAGGFYKADGTTQVLGVDSSGRRLLMNGASTSTDALVIKPNGSDNFLSFLKPDGTLVGTVTYGGLIFLASGANDLEFRSSTTAGRGIVKRLTNSTSFYRVINVDGYALLNVSAGGITTFVVPLTATNTITNILVLAPTSTGTPAAGFGSAISVKLRSSTTDDQDAGRLSWEWSTATHASRASKGKLSAYYTSSERECIAWEANSTVPLVGFYGVAPVARPTAYTQSYSTAARTVNAYTTDAESAAYTGIDNAQAGTVYAQLTDINALRTAYENLRASHDNLLQVVNSLIDDGQAVGLLQ